ncbi:MAG: rRNA small subunit methyltransferase B [Actinomyces ruminicola]|nr:rRNA small subunit methyltransferase B [Actinomyces ruminicola]
MRDEMTLPDHPAPSPDTGPDRRRPARASAPDVDPARLACLHTLTKVREDDAYANLVLPTILDQARLGRRDAGFATALTYGTLRLQGRYDAIIAECIDRPLPQVDAVVLDVLRLGAHQLLAMRVPTHAAVSTTVDLAAYSAGRGASGFVNAVMRRISEHDLEDWLARLRADASDTTAALARAQSHPAWVVKALRQALKVNGRDADGELEALLEADNTDPQVTLCARPGLITVDELSAQVRAATGEEPRPGRLSPYALVLSGGDPGRIEAVRDSRAGVEDEASQLVALILAQAPLEGHDERWLDLCAGPGGKAALLGALAADRGATLVANEVAVHRARLVEAAVRALPDGVVTVRAEDGRKVGSQEPGAYDRILVDAPCSGLGSLRRRPEARWRRTPQDVAALAELQRELLAGAAAAARPGGLIAYVTCSPHVLETGLVVRDVTRQLARAGIELEPLHAGRLAADLAPQAPAGADRQMLQTWPHLDDSDAMFCALLRRNV